MCFRCTIGSRECLYPSTVEVSRPDNGASIEEQHQLTDKLALSSEMSDPDETSIQLTDLSLASTSNTDSPSSVSLDVSTDRAPVGRLSEVIYVNASAKWESSMDTLPNLCYGYDPSVFSVHSAYIQKMPRLIPDQFLPFFLSFHQENINHGRYSWYYDYHQFISKGLIDMAKRFDSLQYALAAFSSLVYSVTIDRHAKPFAFVFYTKAVRLLQQMINAIAMNDVDSRYGTVATILELASVEGCVFGL